MKVMRDVDVQRYMGRWYEIANIPTRFQPGDSTNTMATYSLLDDGRIGVVNQTFSSGGSWVGIAGKAYKADPSSSEAKFVVNFWVPPFLPIFPSYGDYWILHLDADYKVAVVGEPSQQTCWILSRDPSMSDEEYQKIVDGPVKEAGYDTSSLVRTTHLTQGVPKAPPKPVDSGSWWIFSPVTYIMKQLRGGQ